MNFLSEEAINITKKKYTKMQKDFEKKKKPLDNIIEDLRCNPLLQNIQCVENLTERVLKHNSILLLLLLLLL